MRGVARRARRPLSGGSHLAGVQLCEFILQVLPALLQQVHRAVLVADALQVQGNAHTIRAAAAPVRVQHRQHFLRLATISSLSLRRRLGRGVGFGIRHACGGCGLDRSRSGTPPGANARCPRRFVHAAHARAREISRRGWFSSTAGRNHRSVSVHTVNMQAPPNVSCSSCGASPLVAWPHFVSAW